MAILAFLAIFPAMLVGFAFLLIFMIVDIIFDTDLVLWAFGLLDSGWGDFRDFSMLGIGGVSDKFVLKWWYYPPKEE